MTWRTIYISDHCHLSYKNNALLIRTDDVQSVYLDEINTIILDSNAISLSTYLMNELVKAKVKVIVCDEKHNPCFELVPYHVAYDSSRVIAKELSIDNSFNDQLWKQIIKFKIHYQATVLKKFNRDSSVKLDNYSLEVEIGDTTNREGHAAKVYFNSLFGIDFSRDQDCNINAYLDYGYTILLSMFNRELVNAGYITQIGIHHKGATNPYNLSCDLMEPFRPIIDGFAFMNQSIDFCKEQRIKLIELLNEKYKYQDKNMYFNQVVNLYVNNLMNGLLSKQLNDDWFIYGEL